MLRHFQGAVNDTMADVFSPSNVDGPVSMCLGNKYAL